MRSDEEDFKDIVQREIKTIKFHFDKFQTGFALSNDLIEHFAGSEVHILQDHLMDACKVFVSTYIPLHEEHKEEVQFAVYKTWWDHLKVNLPNWIRKRLKPSEYRTVSKTVTVSLIGKNIVVPDKFNSGYYTVYST